MLLAYFTFTSGIVFEATNSAMNGTFDTPYSLSLSGERLNIVGIFNEDDITCANWLVDNKKNVPLATDYNGYALLMGCMNEAGQYSTPEKDEAYYLFLTSWNVENELMVVGSSPALRKYNPLPNTDNATVVFSKGDAIIYYVK